MRPVRDLCTQKSLWCTLAVLAVLPGVARAQGVSVGIAGNGLSSLKYSGTEYLSNGSFQVTRVILVDGAGNQTDGSLSGTSAITGPNTVTWTFNWGTVQVLYAPAGNRLNLTISTTNSSSQTIAGLFYTVFNLKFPSQVQEFDGVTPLVDSNIGAPTLISMTSAASTMVFANDDVTKPLMAGFPWALDKPANTTFPLRVNTNRDPMYPSFWPFINRPISSGGSDQYHLSLRFGAPGSTLQALGGDLYQSFGAAFPPQFSWTDRRPIGMLILGTSAAGYPTNPRGWLLDPTIDVTTPAGLAQFQTRILQWADNSVQVLQSVNAQGMITWDIEGEQFPQPTSYVCDPTQFAMTAPEMVNVADAYFKKFRDAGLKVGVCVRPQQFVLAPGGGSASQQDVADPTQLLINKINYARNRWGATIFYIDSDGGPGNPMDPGILQRVSAAEPGVLIMPEHSNLQYYAYSAPYRQVNQGKTSAESDARLVYPQGFAILNLADAPIQQDYNQLVTAVSQGDVLMFRGWFDDGSLSSVRAIYQAAGQPGIDTTPPTVSIVSPLPNATISAPTTVSASASDNVGVARVQFLVDSSPLGGPILTPPYSTTLSPAQFTNGPHTLNAVATDLSGNSANASIGIIISNLDSIPPAVSILTPLPNSIITAPVTVSASASDNVGVAKVQFLVDGSPLGAPDLTPPYSTTLSPASFANGPHTLTAVATDLSGNSANASIGIVISNADTIPPSISITSPGGGSTVSGTITLSASASDNVGVASVQFQLDGSNFGAKLGTAPYSLTLNTTTLGNGPHTVSALAADAAGNTATSAQVQFTVNNAPVTGCNPGNGVFTGCYYTGQNFDSFVFSRTDPVIHFDWSGTGPQGPIALGPDNYSVRWLGNFQFQAGTYQFIVNTDDGGRLFIDGNLIYGNWIQHGALPVTVNASLTAGVHLIEFDYFQNQGGAVAQLSWTGPAGGPPPPAPPTIAITVPTSGVTLSGTVSVSASVTAAAGVAWVQFQLDGSSLAGQLVSPPFSISVNTTAIPNGNHTLTAVVRDQAGNSATSAPVPVIVSNSTTPPGPSSCGAPGTGVFTGCYYSGQNFDNFVFSRTDPVIYFDWSGTGPRGPLPLGPDNYSVRWQGNFQLQGGTYQFLVNTDDGGRLFVDGQLLYGNWTQHGAMPIAVTTTLGPGVHLIELDYFQSQGGAVAQLSWTPSQ